MDPLHREVAEARGPEGAPITDAVPEDPPSEEGPVLVVPRGPQDLAVIVRLRRAEPKRDCADPLDLLLPRLRRHVSRKRNATYLSSFGAFPLEVKAVFLAVDTALVLAGGESERFGEPKSLVDVAGKPMIRRVVDAIGPLAGEVVVSVAVSAIVPVLQSIVPEASFVVDRQTGRGPIEGFRRGFDIARGDRVLVAPCDAPLLRPELYRLFLRSLGHYESVVPKFDVFDPVRAVYRRQAVARVLRSQKSNVASPSGLVDHLRSRFIDADRIRAVDPDLSSFFDVNTRADLDDVLAKLERPSAGQSS
ncbi:MAG: molybdenum cofactor guanylyltransferase [Methanobacteriota archaeon]|nr:MAG: molybdenum cofactor guanylyltransferase [Euryarchaeota archaeon]